MGEHRPSPTHSGLTYGEGAPAVYVAVGVFFFSLACVCEVTGVIKLFHIGRICDCG
jgi:hypothetical protein